MNMRSKYFLLGLFSLSGIALVVIGTFWFLFSTSLQRGITVETYLDESVQGLYVGSTLKYRGLKIGSIQKMDFVRRIYPESVAQNNSFQNSILIQVNIETNSYNLWDNIQHEIEKGLRMRLSSSGIVGGSFLEMDYFDPKDNPVLDISWTPKKIYIPSTQGVLKKIGSSLEALAQQTSQIQLAEAVENFNHLVVVFTKTVERSQADKLSVELRHLVAESRETNKRLIKIMKDSSARSLPSRISRIVSRIETSSTSFDRILGSSQEGITEAIENLKIASRNIQELSSTAKKYPSYLLFGKPPSKRK